MIWNVMQLFLVLTIKQLNKDVYGLRVEIVFIQILFCFSWGASGIMQAFFPEIYLTVGIFTDLSAMLAHALIVFAYPLM